jgi:hypothetical protein
VVFGLWAVVLLAAIAKWFGWPTAKDYVAHTVDYTEAVFVFVVMAVAATRPIVTLADSLLRRVARLGGETAAAWWLTILIVGPLLGSLITEPAAMTLCALLLGRQLYAHGPSARLGYATLGLLFVNVSVGGTLTHFAAPPVLMVARVWEWDLGFMLTHFGWRAVRASRSPPVAYFLLFRRELRALGPRPRGRGRRRWRPVPAWIVAVHVAFLVWTVVNSHYVVLFLGGFLFFLGFVKATAAHQEPVDLTSPVLVGFFLAGLVIRAGSRAGGSRRCWGA